ncbi:MAG TPA: glycosyltransferase family 4 protein, partial [Bryobacteraceae bacterium]|nr:glycosyltransferase family 4 protein [Bryobacteraceae bacterium]
MNPIRVAHIMPFPNVGGTERATLRLAEAAAHCGFENTIYCPRDACELKHFYHEHAFSTATYDQIEPSYHHPLPYLRAAQTLAQDMKRRHVRIVHCADILGAHYVALAGRLAGAFVISHVRCQHSSITRRDQTFLYPLQKFVFVSKNTWEVFGMTVPKEKGEVLYDGIAEMGKPEKSPADIRAQYGLPADGPVIGMASRVHPCKDFESLILAARIVNQSFPECRYAIAGDYEQNAAHREHYRHLQQMLGEVGLSDRFVFVGLERDMARFFAAIDVFVLSSHAEGLPLVILEAMANRKPVVATNVGGMSEVIEDGRSGLLVPPKAPDELARALMTPLGNTEKANELAQAAQRSIQENFGEQPFQKRVRELYCTIAK